MNSIMLIQPYRHQGMWVFDDEKLGLVQEPFVAGADTVIDRMVANIPNAEEGINLVFSAQPFPGHQVRFEWRREEYGGNWYHATELAIDGWLCPALFKYFETTPKEIFAQFKPIGT